MTLPAPAAPPRLARWLLRRALDGPARSAIVGDLDEEFVRFALPQLGARRARRWYWRQATTSIVACALGGAVANREPDEPPSTVRDIMQDAKGWWTDTRAALRFCVRSPFTSAAVIVTLAIGVGATTAVFSIVNAALLKSLPIANADRLVTIRSKPGGAFSYPEYLETMSTPGLTATIAGGRTSVTMGGGADRRRLTADLVSANYFEALGTAAAPVGRLLAPADDASGSAPVVVLAHRFWRRQFAASPAVVGSSLRLNRGFFTIVGVAPAGFAGTHAGYGPDLWVPLTHAPMMEGNPAMLDASAGWLGLLGILDTPDSLIAAREALGARWRAAGTREAAELTLIPRGTSTFDGTSALQLRILSLFVLVILAVACLNVATLLGGLVQERRKELAIRSSLGAGRIRLLRQLLAEHALLAIAGGTVGGAAGIWLARALAPHLAGPFAPTDLDVGADGNVVLFTTALSLLVAVAVGLVPAFRWSRVHTIVDLQASGAGMRRLLRTAGVWWLIPWQVALGTVLLASAGVFAKTVQQLKLGIETSAPERVWFADVHLDAESMSAASFEGLMSTLRRHLQGLSGAEAAALATNRPLASSRRGPLLVEGMTMVPDSAPMPWGAPPPPPPPRKGGGKNQTSMPPGRMWLVSNNYVTPGFFASLALPVARGRDFTVDDGTRGKKVAIVNETLAKRAFGEADPIGRRVAWAGSDAYDIEIVGVVRDLRSEHLRTSAPDAIFFPLAQAPFAGSRPATTAGGRESMDLTVLLRARPGARLRGEQLLQHLRAFDSRMFVDDVWTFDDEAGRMLSQERLLAASGWVLGAIALALLIVGLYGTLTAAVARGRRELGIRLALGASPRSIGGTVVARAVAVAATGLALGLPLSYAFLRSFAHMLYGVKPIEPLVVAVTIAIVLATAALAAYVPARRASRVDPLIALRSE